MADSPLRAKGRAMRRKLMGDAFADKLDKSLYTDPIMEKFAEVTQETIFGTLWTRPGLDIKTRALICIISDTATGRTPELKLHIRFARNQGWSEDELVESMLHLLGYVGAPLVREALMTAKEVFAEMRAEADPVHHEGASRCTDLHYWPTPNGKKVSILLEELGVPYNVIPCNIGRGDQFTPEFLKMNPNHRMPVLVDREPKGGGEPISVFESGAIMMYIAEKEGNSCRRTSPNTRSPSG